jgi:hypothetical protein
MLGRMEQHVATESILNLPDSVVTWPVTISARARHGLNDADVTRAAALQPLAHAARGRERRRTDNVG